jgi:glycolate oxidase iron-sulfur subunit
METHFTESQRADPDITDSERVLRACVHCGFCTATCPTYVLLGDELDSPRGRIYLIRDMLESDRKPQPEVVKHIDRCLSCLACMTTCPSGVNYMHLIDHARQYVERNYRRPWPDRALRLMLAMVLPRPMVFRLVLQAARLARPMAPALPSRLRAMLALAPGSPTTPSNADRPAIHPAQGIRRRRVALLTGCAQRAIAPEINEATIRLLTRLGCEVVVARGAGCCGALTHHLGRDARGYAHANIMAWEKERTGAGLDAVVVNASGCGTTVKDYGHMFRADSALAGTAARIAALACDVTELVAELGLPAPAADFFGRGLRVAYHSACSLQHGQRVTRAPAALLTQAGFTVLDVPEGHLCCGSAGTYNILQPAIAAELRARKVENILRTVPDLVATGNLGCMVQIRSALSVPVVHTVALLDWATGGGPPWAFHFASE